MTIGSVHFHRRGDDTPLITVSHHVATDHCAEFTVISLGYGMSIMVDSIDDFINDLDVARSRIKEVTPDAS